MSVRSENENTPVGNAAAMREALEKCREIALQWQADEADGVAGTIDKPSARSAAEAVMDMEFEINAALSAPPRNCDLFACYSEAANYWHENVECADVNGCFDVWLFEPAAERKGEGK